MKKLFFVFVFATMVLAPAVTFTSCGEKEPTQQPNDPDDPDDPDDPQSGVVINGVQWAASNVDKPGTFAAKPEDAGMFYQWGRRVGWSATDPMTNSNGGTEWDDSSVSASAWPSTYDPCPRGWRVPAQSDLSKLADNSKVVSIWTMRGGVSGRSFTDLATEKSIFLPAAGGRYDSNGSVLNHSVSGGYWSSEVYSSSYGYYLLFYSSDVYPSANSNYATGFSVRCVAE